jgi:hypothetical protein
MTINEAGEVVSANNLASKTTTTDQRIINQVISAVKNQVKYSKDPGAGLVSVFLTVKVNTHKKSPLGVAQLRPAGIPTGCTTSKRLIVWRNQTWLYYTRILFSCKVCANFPLVDKR